MARLRHTRSRTACGKQKVEDPVSAAGGATGKAGPFRVNPLMRVLLFRYDPFEVVNSLRQGRAPSNELLPESSLSSSAL
jgi:hypothetical protein